MAYVNQAKRWNAAQKGLRRARLDACFHRPVPSKFRHCSPSHTSPPEMSDPGKIRVRFAPSPTGFLHVGSARTFIFNWLFARHTGGTMILRLDDTDVGRNTQASLDSIFDGLSWLNLEWDEVYHQSQRLEFHRAVAQKILDKGLAYRDFTPALAEVEQKSHPEAGWLCNAGMRELDEDVSEERAAAGEPFVLRFRV